MPRLKLNKKGRPKLKPKIQKGIKVKRTEIESTGINHDESDFPYLAFYDPMTMKFSRVDRYSIKLYIKMEIDGERKWDDIYDLLFYPSKPGMEQIEGFATDETFVASTGLAAQLTHRLEQLKEYGNPHWHIDVTYPITFDNWRKLFKKSLFSKDEEATVVKRVKLKPKIDNPVKKVKLKPKNNRMKLKVSSK